MTATRWQDRCGRTVQSALVSRAYHGTSATHAAAILRDGLLPSDNEYDCLGDGVYFFEDGLAQAGGWATRAHPSEPAVVQADVRLEDCMNLKDSVGWVPLTTPGASAASARTSGPMSISTL